MIDQVPGAGRVAGLNGRIERREQALIPDEQVFRDARKRLLIFGENVVVGNDLRHAPIDPVGAESSVGLAVQRDSVGFSTVKRVQEGQRQDQLFVGVLSCQEILNGDLGRGNPDTQSVRRTQKRNVLILTESAIRQAGAATDSQKLPGQSACDGNQEWVLSRQVAVAAPWGTAAAGSELR